ncbi:MAG: AMP-binding protein, partial [Actinomycetota bacterium]|nr:AMP-binding protein [Actinomycetota bacterium]
MDSLHQVLGLDHGAPALSFGERTYTYGDLVDAVDAVRAALVAAGVTAGAPVATILPNTPAGLVSMLAVLLERACIVTISPRRVADELAKAPATVATLGPASELGAAPVAGALDLAVVAGAPDVASRPGTAVLMATSGTTGEPKRIPITYGTIDGVVGNVRGLAGGDGTISLRDDTTLICFPYTNLSGVLPQLLGLVSGRRTALLERFDPVRVAALVAEHRMTSLALNPTAMQMLMDADIDPGLLATVRYVRSGSAPLRPALAAAFEARFGVGVLQSYGQTEVGGEVVGWSAADHRAHGVDKRGSVGRPHPGLELQVVARGSSPGEPLPAGEVGDLWLRGARNVEGWHRTGDL